MQVRTLITSLRPLQWVKNVLVFAAPLFAYSLSLEDIPVLSATFLVFCAVSSGVYLVNDLLDMEADRLHPLKKNRPLASGALSRQTAIATAGILLLGSLVSGWFVSGLMLLVVATYASLQIVYSLALKHVLFLDMMTLASGFILRAVAGAVAVSVPISPWFLFCVGLLSFYIVLEKRKGELKRMNVTGVTTRPLLKRYSIPYIEQIETVSLACLLLGYALWTIQGAKTEWMMLSLPFVLYGTLRYQYLSDSEIVEKPEEALFRDKPLLLNTALWVLTCFVILALNHMGMIS